MIPAKLFLTQVKTDKQLNFKILHNEKTINYSRTYALACCAFDQ